MVPKEIRTHCHSHHGDSNKEGLHALGNSSYASAPEVQEWAVQHPTLPMRDKTLRKAKSFFRRDGLVNSWLQKAHEPNISIQKGVDYLTVTETLRMWLLVG